MKIIELEVTESTNDEVKKYWDLGEDIAVFARRQTGGRGTKGRSFASPEGGIYISFIKHYRGLKAEKAYEVTEDISLSVALTLRAFGVKAEIKWPNDVYVGKKKICGMLTQNEIKNGYVEKTLCGIGININNDLPIELDGIATSLKKELGREVDLKSVLFTLVYNLEKFQNVELYPSFSCVVGKKVKVFEPQKEAYEEKVDEILPDGRLKLADGKILSVAEIKLL